MKKLTVLMMSFFVFVAMGFGDASAHGKKDGDAHCKKGVVYCPFVVSSHAKELKLTGAQKKALEKIKVEAKASQDKIQLETKAVLTPKQVESYESISATCEKKGMSHDKGSCPKNGGKKCCDKNKK